MARAQLQPDGYSVSDALKAVLFDTLADAATGTLDLQALLLYACDSAAKAFAVLGFFGAQEAGCKMLSLDGVYEVLHRECTEGSLTAAEHHDPFSRSALARLFTELKIDAESEAASYAQVVAHPAGAALFGLCTSYSPKGAYDLVEELLDAAGNSLKI